MPRISRRVTLFEHTSYRSFLKAELASRVASNPRYSLRAFARGLGIPASHLSAIHHGRRNLSLDTAGKVARKLGLDGPAHEYFLILVQLEALRPDAGPELREALRARAKALKSDCALAQVRDLSLDAFRAISDWYHLPILEITGLVDPRARRLDARWVAARLGIKAIEVEAATERLERLELLERAADGTYRKTYVHGLFQSAASHAPLRRFHQTLLQKAQIALEEQAPTDRYVGSQTFAMHPAQLAGAREVIEAFRRQLVAYFDGSGSADAQLPKEQVYFLGVQLFNLTTGTAEVAAPKNSGGQ